MSKKTDKSLCLISPFTMIVAGCTMSGKTELVKKIILKSHKLLAPPPENIIICYAEYQSAYDDIQKRIPNVRFIKGLNFEIEDFQPSSPSLLVIDDQMNDLVKSNKIQELFTKGVHHRMVSVILLQQNLYPQGKHGRDIRLNSHYIAVMKSPTFHSQIACLGRQIFPNNPSFLNEAYKSATETPYKHLFINLHPLCDDQLRVSEGILDKENIVFFLPK